MGEQWKWSSLGWRLPVLATHLQWEMGDVTEKPTSTYKQGWDTQKVISTTAKTVLSCRSFFVTTLVLQLKHQKGRADFLNDNSRLIVRLQFLYREEANYARNAYHKDSVTSAETVVEHQPQCKTCSRSCWVLLDNVDAPGRSIDQLICSKQQWKCSRKWIQPALLQLA